MILATDILMLVFVVSAPLAVWLAYTLRDSGGGGGEPPAEFVPWNPDPGGLELPAIDWDAELRTLTAELVLI